MNQAEKDAQLAQDGWRPISELVLDDRRIEVMSDCFAIDREVTTARKPAPLIGEDHWWCFVTHFREVTGKRRSSPR